MSEIDAEKYKKESELKVLMAIKKRTIVITGYLLLFTMFTGLVLLLAGSVGMYFCLTWAACYMALIIIEIGSFMCGIPLLVAVIILVVAEIMKANKRG